jgi:CRP/FNR family transcriptional regulator, anaerobic regulatory protein
MTAPIPIAEHNVRELTRCELCPTQKACLAQRVTPSQQQCLADTLRVVSPLHAGVYLYRAGTQVQGQYHIRSGMVKTFVTTAAGEECVTGFYIAGETLNSGRGSGVHSESAVALETTSLCRLDAQAIEHLGRQGLSVAMLEKQAEQASYEVMHQVNLRQTSAEKRFAGYCMQYGLRRAQLGLDEAVLPTPMSRTDLASYLGMKLESLSRVISRLQSRGLIAARRDQITVLQAAELAELADHLRY